MRAIELREYGDPAECPLSVNEAAALAATGLVALTPVHQSNHWLLTPQGKVGAVSVGDLTVRVAPKVAVDRIVFMLGYAMRGIGWHDGEVHVDPEADVAHAIAEVFLRSIARAVRPGLLQGYRVVEEALPVVRGRIRTDEQLKRRPGQWLPIEVTFDDFTVDIAENQLILAAMDRLLRLPSVPKPLKTKLAGMATQFSDVRRLTPGAPLPHWSPSRLNLRYQIPLHLAELILRAASFEHRAGNLALDGYVLDMPKIFEDFVSLALQESLQATWPGTRVKCQDGMHLDLGKDVPIKPDIVWRSDSGRPLAVMDAKYKAEKPSGFPQADIYQALAYAIALGLPIAHLIYAKGDEATQHYHVRNVGVEVRVHTLDLECSSQQLLTQIDVLASSVASSRVRAAA